MYLPLQHKNFGAISPSINTSPCPTLSGSQSPAYGMTSRKPSWYSGVASSSTGSHHPILTKPCLLELKVDLISFDNSLFHKLLKK